MLTVFLEIYIIIGLLAACLALVVIKGNGTRENEGVSAKLDSIRLTYEMMSQQERMIFITRIIAFYPFLGFLGNKRR